MMGAPECPQLHLVLDRDGAVMAFRESLMPWAGMVAFTSEAGALKFCRDSGIAGAQVAAVDMSDEASLRALIAQVKPKGIRHLLLDLDYKDGSCVQYEFEADWFGASRPHRFQAQAH